MFSINDICSGEKFQQLCDVYCGVPWHLDRNPIIRAQKEKHLNLEELHLPYDNPKLVFCYSCSLELLMNKIHLFKNKFVLVSHNEDENVTEKYLPLANNPMIIKWFAQNLMIDHDKVEPLPIGIANSMWPHGNIEHLIHIQNKYENVEKTNDFFFNFSLSTNERARFQCKTIIESKGLTFIYHIPREIYLEKLASYKFAICPEGNGIDCHRLWEAYYLNVIPIMLKNQFSLHIQKYLPCVLLNSWDDFDLDYCNKYYELYKNQLLEARKSLLFDTYKTNILTTIQSNSALQKDSVPNLNVAYCFIGPLPTYTLESIHQLRLFYNGPVYFILNDYDNLIVNILKNTYNVTIIRYDDVYHEEFNKIITISYNKFCIVKGLKEREKLFIYAFERFFVLYNFMVKYAISNIFFLELDNLIYDDPTKWLKEFSKQEMAFMFDNFDRGASGVCFIKDAKFLNNFLDHCIEFILYSDKFKSEMMALYSFWEKNKNSIQLLPIHWPDSNMPIQTFEAYQNYENSIFDAAAIGIYLGGLDLIHSGGVLTKYQKSQWSYIDYTKYQYKWEKDACDRNIPYILNGNKWLQINNLHIHSKDLASNLSKPLLTTTNT
jgi:hypothetical protein